MRIWSPIAAVLFGLVACTSPETTSAEAPPVAAAAVHPESGLPVVPLTVAVGDAVHTFRAEYVVKGEDLAKGLMFRTELAPDEGMIFDFREKNAGRETILSFYMKNTVIPLDIIFIDADGKVVNVAAEAVPYSLTSIKSAAPALSVLEIAGGRAAELGIGPGAQVTYEAPSTP